MTAQRQGLLLCLVAAAGFSTTGIFAKLAYQSHASSLVGVVLVFSGGVAHRDGLGVALSLAAALIYAVLILIVDRIGSVVRPLVLSTLVPTGSAVTFVVGGLLLGNLQLSMEPEGWGAIVGLAIVATVVPPAPFYADIARVGPSTASILLTVEPALTVLLAAIVLHERLGPLQFLGGALVLAAVLILQRPSRVNITAESNISWWSAMSADASQPIPIPA